MTSVSPEEGPLAGGTAIVIKGTGFETSGETVKIGSVAATVTEAKATEIKATTGVATSAGTDEVVVSEPKGVSVDGPFFTYIAGPKVTSITPAVGSTAGGTTVKIKGTGFLSGSTVKIGTTTPTSVDRISETEISAVTAAESTVGEDEVIVKDAGGESNKTIKFKYIEVPTVTGVAPAKGPTTGGTEIVLTGTGFTSASTVKVGGVAATGVSFKSATELKAKTPAGSVGSDEVVVSNEAGASTTNGTFEYETPPTVTSIAPEEGPTGGGTAIVIKGTGFETSGETVKIGSVTATVTEAKATEIKATTGVATSAGTDEVVVTEPKGTSTGGPFFTYIAPAKVTSITPAVGSTAGGTTVKIKGTGFLSGSTVKIGTTTPTSVDRISETEISAVTAAESTVGEDEVIVKDAGGESNKTIKFKYIEVPTVTGVAPAKGPTTGGTEIVLTGTGFTSASTVKVGGVAATGVSFKSATELKAKTPAGSVGSDEVVVSNEAGASTTNGTFEYETPPTVTSIAPEEGPTGGGTAIVIKGTGFETSGETVKIGSVTATVTEAKATEIKATTGVATSAGTDEVVVTEPKGTSTGGPFFTYIAPAKVTSITPAVGSTAGGTTVKIKGTGFLSGSTVKIGTTTPTSVDRISETEISAVTAAESTVGEDEVIVKDAGGESNKTIKFKYIELPTVTGVAPAKGPTTGGTEIVLTGTGFTSASTVKVGGVAATGVSFKSATELKAKTPAGSVGSDEVVVSNEAGASTTNGTFEYETPPAVTSVSPEEGPLAGGTAIVIKGTGFETSGETVKIGSVTATVTEAKATEIKATTGVATSAGTDEVVVTEPKGTSTGGPFFTYIAPAKVTSITPAVGSTAGGTTVKIKGTGFLSGSTVKIGTTTPTSVDRISETEISAVTAAESTVGEDEVIVKDAGGESNKTIKFKYIEVPTVTGVAPAKGPTTGGTEIVITGTGFTSASTVKVGGVAATGVSFKSATELKAKTPAGSVGSDEVVVSNEAGASTTNGTFEYETPPSVTSISPEEGPTGGGTAIVIKGTGFETSGETVKIGSVTATVTEAKATEIKATTGVATSAGTDEVVVTEPKGTSTGGPFFTYIAPAKVTSITPAVGSTAGGTTVKIKGTGFLSGSTVKIGTTTPTSVDRISETEISAVTAAESTVGEDEVVVKDAGGESNKTIKFKYIEVPTVTGVAPAKGPTTGGTEIVLTGTGFTSASTVKVGGVAATGVSFKSATELKAKHPLAPLAATKSWSATKRAPRPPTGRSNMRRRRR